MKKLLFFFLMPVISLSQTQIGADIDGAMNLNKLGISVAISSDGNLVAAGSEEGFNPSTNSRTGLVTVRENQSGNWVVYGSTIYGTLTDGHFGSSLDMSSDGSVIAIGADEEGSGNVYIYEFENNDWTLKGNVISGIFLGDWFGRSVSLSSDGNKVAVGAPEVSGNGGNQNPSGYVQVFEFQGGDWLQLGNDLEGENLLDAFGYSVSLSSDGAILSVGIPLDDEFGESAGGVNIYEFITNEWIQIGSGIRSESTGVEFGRSVSLSSNGSILAVGSPFASISFVNSGQVKVFENIAGNWVKIGQNIDGEGEFDRSGTSVSLSADGSIVTIGAPNNNGSNGDTSGHARVYKNIEDNWSQIGTDIDGETFNNDFGRSICLSADANFLIVGGPLNDGGDPPGNGTYIGHARVYDLSDILSIQSSTLIEVTLSPNPASVVVNINSGQGTIIENVHLYNAFGQHIFSQKSSQIDVSELSNGLYFIDITTNMGSMTKKLAVH